MPAPGQCIVLNKAPNKDTLANKVPIINAAFLMVYFFVVYNGMFFREKVTKTVDLTTAFV
jgi:hypothetical protein